MNSRKLARLICPGFRFGVTDPYDAVKLAGRLAAGGRMPVRVSMLEKR